MIAARSQAVRVAPCFVDPHYAFSFSVQIEVRGGPLKINLHHCSGSIHYFLARGSSSRGERSLITLSCSIDVAFICEAIMRLSLRIVAIATVSACMCLHTGPAAAQTFDERWSIIPNAHAEPAPETPHAEPTPATPDENKPALQARPPIRRRVCTWFRGSLSHSIIQPSFFRKGLILFVSDRKNSERFIVQSEFANCSTPQPAVRHESSRY